MKGVEVQWEWRFSKDEKDIFDEIHLITHSNNKDIRQHKAFAVKYYIRSNFSLGPKLD